MRRTCLLLTLYGFLLASAVSAGLKNSRPKFKIATTSTTESPLLDDESEIDGNKTEGLDGNSTASHNLTGIPQIDYIWDPNLPRELNGYNLSDYPFYETIPKDIDFKCDGLHDGFYASVPHKCQVYHHCLYGTRYDFLCANFTAFDQKTFICHFVSEIDCANSKKYWHRNDALYQAASTTTIAPPPTTTTTTTTTTAAPIQPPEFADSPRSGGRRRRPFRRRPAYDYYDQEYYDDDYERPRTRGSGYDRRDDYDYDDRQQYNARNRDRERDREHFRDHPRDRDRDYRDRDPVSRPREYSTERPVAVRDEEDSLVMRPRDRFPSRNNRRDPPRVDEADNERRHQDQRYDRGFAKDDYDDEPASETLVKPAAPSTSVYARPRAPPKIRRPVPLSEQDRFAYKASSVQPIVGEHKRTTTTSTTESSVARDQDYYEDELEERPARRPVRRRPYRERDRHLIDASRDVRDRERDRERDRPLRPSRYRDEEDDMRPRKYPERPRDRDRYYERARDRALLDREKDSSVIMDRERDHRPGMRRPALRDKENDRLPSQQSGKDSAEEAQSKETSPITRDYEDAQGSKDRDPVTRPTVDDKVADDKKEEPEVHKLEDDYPPDDEYYDDEYSFSSSTSSSSSSSAPASTTLSPRMTVRIVKRPFLPSRGGNPNPRGLSPVGIKAPDSGSKDPKPLTPSISIKSLPSSTGNPKRPIKVEDRYQDRSYDAYRIIDTDKKKNDFDSSRTDPLAQDLGPQSQDGFDPNWKAQNEKSEIKAWAPEERRPSPNRGNRLPNNTHSNNNFGEQNRKDVTGPSSVAKQRVNEVPHHLVDIPESEYDVALNEALTPSLNQDSLPSGFVLPLQRQGNREPALQPSENNYRVRPFKPDASHQLQAQHHQYHPQQPQQQKSFAPSPGFFPLTRINDERTTTSTQYYKTPEVVHVGAYNRQADRNPWHDYTGY